MNLVFVNLVYIHLVRADLVTAPDLYLNQAFLTVCSKGRTGSIPVGEDSRPQTDDVVVIK